MKTELNKFLLSFDFFLVFFFIILLGAYFNSLAVFNNNCKMPVNADYSFETNKHISYKKIAENGLKLEYEAFTDKFKINLPYNYFLYISIGDILMYSGVFFLVISSIFLSVYLRRLKKHIV